MTCWLSGERSLPFGLLVFSLVPYRQQSTQTDVMPRKKYSPFDTQAGNKVEYAMAKLDDLVNWGRKVA